MTPRSETSAFAGVARAARATISALSFWRGAAALCAALLLVLPPHPVTAQDKGKPARVYFIGEQRLALFGYDLTETEGRPTVMAVFRPLPDQAPLDPERFDYITACEAVLAAPPMNPHYPRVTEPLQHALVFAQNVSPGVLGLAATVTGAYRELDVSGGACALAAPGSLYRPLGAQ